MGYSPSITPDRSTMASYSPKGAGNRSPGIPTGGGPPGAEPGTQAYWDWYSKHFNQDQFSPGGTLSEILGLGQQAGGFKDPMGALGKTPANMWAVGRRSYGQGLSNLGRAGFAPGTQPNVTAPNVGITPVNYGTLDEAIKRGSSLGQTAAGMIPNQPVRSIGEASSQIGAVTPGANALMGAVTPALNSMAADAAAGKGLMGIPSSEVAKMQGQNVAEANAAQEASLRALGVDASAAGTYGQPNYDSQVASEYASQYAPALISAVQQPENESYQLGAQNLNALTGAVSGVEVPLTKMAAGINEQDLANQLQAGTARADVYGKLAGQGLNVGGDLAGNELKTGQSAQNLQAQLGLDAQTQNLDAWLKQFDTLAGPAFQAPWQGYNAAQGAIGNKNQLTMDLVKQALQEAGSLRNLHNQRKQQNWQNTIGLIGGISGGLGNLFPKGIPGLGGG